MYRSYTIIQITILLTHTLDICMVTHTSDLCMHIMCILQTYIHIWAINIYIHKYITYYIYTYMCMYMDTHIFIHAYNDTRINVTNLHTSCIYIHTIQHVHAYTHTYVHMCIYVCGVYVHIVLYEWIHTHDTYTHTHMPYIEYIHMHM